MDLLFFNPVFQIRDILVPMRICTKIFSDLGCKKINFFIFYNVLISVADPDVFWDSYARNYRPCFRENQPKRCFLLSENERFGLVFVKTGSINSGTGSGSISQRCGSGSFYHQAKIVRKTLIPTVL